MNSGLTHEEKEEIELRKFFNKFDEDGNGSITATEIGNVMKELGEDIPGYKIRDIIREVDKDENGKVEFDEFKRIYKQHSKTSVGLGFKELIKTRDRLQNSGGNAQSSAEGTKHSYHEGERIAFVEWIKTALKNDQEFQAYLPIHAESQEIFKKLKDGIILCKMINVAVPETIDERAITKGKPGSKAAIRENLTLALNSARSIGCSIVNIGAEDIEKGTPHLVLGLLWQIIRLGLFANITLSDVPELVALLQDGEDLDEFQALSPEDILLRWFNYQLEQAGSSRRVENFSVDIMDSQDYCELLKVMLKHAGKADQVDSSAIKEENHTRRAERMLAMANALGCKKFVRPKDVVAGDPKLNMAFVANLFNYKNEQLLHHCLPPVSGSDTDGHGGHGHLAGEVIEETDEERTYRNWMNSIGVHPHVNSIYRDLRSGLVLLDVFDIIEPGIVENCKVKRPPYKFEEFDQRGNCIYVIEIAKEMEVKGKGINVKNTGGENIYAGDKNLTLGIVWQLMRAYTVSVLSKLTADGSKMEDQDIIDWANAKFEEAGKSSRITRFNDPEMKDKWTGLVLDLVDAIKPGTVNYANVTKGISDDDKHRDAVYALSVARKIGAATYALPDHLVEGNPEMVMTVFACLMAANLVIEKKSKKKK